jgi:hypothetical protein
MGYMKHNAAIVTNWDLKELEAAHLKAKEIFKAKFEPDVMVRDAERLVSDIVHGITNSQASFLLPLMAVKRVGLIAINQMKQEKNF